MPIHNSMDALAAAALSYGNDEGPRLVKLSYSPLFTWTSSFFFSFLEILFEFSSVVRCIVLIGKLVVS